LVLGFEGFLGWGAECFSRLFDSLSAEDPSTLYHHVQPLFGLAHVSGAVGRVTWGLVSDRLFEGQRKRVYMFIALISGVTLCILGNLTATTPLWMITVIVAILGFTAVGHQGVGLSLISEVAGKEFTGTASGFNQSFYFLGAVVMAPLFGLMVDLFGTYTVAWMSLALFSFVASGFVLFVREDLKKS
jgi:sugar phosphate permease